jgi:hypothetical protein
LQLQAYILYIQESLASALAISPVQATPTCLRQDCTVDFTSFIKTLDKARGDYLHTPVGGLRPG